MEEVTIAELLEALEDAQAVEADGFTTRDLADHLGVGAATARRRIRTMLREDLVEACRVVRTGIDGVDYPVSGFRRKNGASA